MTLLPQIANDLNIDEPTAGHIISAYALGVVFGAPVLALWASNWARRRALVVMLCVFVVTHVASLFAGSYHSLLVLRFLSGLPHGAFLGISALFAGGLMGKANRGKAVARVMMGLTVATVIGAPLTNWLGQALNWRVCLGVAALVAFLAMIGLLTSVPSTYRQVRSEARHELGALKNIHIWLTLVCGAIGFGGMFAVYTYLASLLETVSGLNAEYLPLVFCCMGVGMTLGNLILGYFADKSVPKSVTSVLIWSICWLSSFPLISANAWLVALWVLMIGIGGGFATALQVRLMDVAGKAQTMAAALNHSSFNMANALGPFLAGLAIDAGFGFPSVGYVGAALAGCGLLVWLFAMALSPSESKPQSSH